MYWQISCQPPKLLLNKKSPFIKSVGEFFANKQCICIYFGMSVSSPHHYRDWIPYSPTKEKIRHNLVEE